MDFCLSSVVCRLSSVLRGVLMANKTLFCSFYVSFCTFCASLRLTRTVFSWLLKKAISMALWTKASFFSYITPSRPQMARYAARYTRFYTLYAVRYPLYKLLSSIVCRLLSVVYRLFFTTVVSALQIDTFLCKTNPISEKVK